MPIKVLIVGTDVATLTLALVLEQAGIDYLVLEPHESVPVVAGGITLHPTVLPLLEQLALKDDLLFFSQPLEHVDILDANMDYISSHDYSQWQTRYGSWTRFMSRPEYCDMVLNKLPESKVLFNKKILRISTLEGSESGTFNDEHGRQDSILDSDDLEKQPPQLGVVCTCADGSVYSAHVVVGDVDSRIERKVDVTQQPQQTPQSIMRHRRSGTGSGSSMISGGVSGDRKDSSSREFQYFVSGITEPLDPQRIPLLREDTTQLRLAIDAKSSFSWWAATMVDNRIAWQVTKRVSLSEKSSLPEDGMGDDPNRILHQISPSMMCPLGGTMAQLVLWTSRFQISCKRWDDQRVLSTTSSSRVLLLGEACRKVIPLFGQTVDESILDALALGEALFNLPSTELCDIKTAFELYHKERGSKRDAAIAEARDLDQLLHSKRYLRSLYRSVLLNYTPKYITDKKNDAKYAYRPQASFLSLVPDYGTVPPNKESLAGGNVTRDGGRRIPGREKNWAS
ncbi:hypothetical protein CPC16_003085 [Podila verticillata]|nr:hypothetical protein CPC16_003085 [Podila verticillata]